MVDLEDVYRDVLLRITAPLPNKPQGWVFVAGVVVWDAVSGIVRRIK